MSFYFRQKQIRPQTTSQNRQLDQSSIRDSKLLKQFTTPKMGIEKENLYDENIKLKSQLNEIAQQLIQTRSRVQQLEKELQRFENLLEDQIKSESPNQKFQVERHGLVLKMKTRQKQLIQELQKRTKELDDLKKTMRYTNYQELEIELKNYIDETIRLRAKLDFNEQMIAIQSSGEPLEKKILHLEKTIKIISKDNQELNIKQQLNDSIINKLQIQLDESIKQNDKYLNDIIKYEKTIKDLTEYNRQCNDVISQLQFQNKIQIQVQQQSVMSEELQKTQLLLDQNSTKHQQDIDQKSQEIRALKTEIQRLNLQIQDMDKMIENQEDKIRELESNAYSPISKIGNIESPLQNGFKIMQIEMKPTNIKKKLPKVQFQDITQICMRIKLNLVKHKIPFLEIENYFNGEDELSIHQVKNIIHKYPFEIKDHEQIKLFSRYLVEDNSEDYVLYDQEMKNSSAIIKSVVKKIIGKYEILSNEEEQQILQQIKKKLIPSISETISMMTIKKKHLQPGTCDQSDLEQALKFHEIQFTQQEMERFNLIVFEVSNSIECINYERLLTYFK